MRQLVVLGILHVGLLASPAFAQVPDRMNYQGVLRDASDRPLDGVYDMVFRLFDDEQAGEELLVDRHSAAAGGAVVVTGGLFSVVLGDGEVSDGAGPGNYTSLAEVFRDHGQVFLEVEVEGEVLTPRVGIHAAAYAMNADHLDGQDSGSFASASHGHAGSDIVGPVGLALAADALSGEPDSCPAGEFVRDLQADGTLVCAGPASGATGEIQYGDGAGGLRSDSALTYDEPTSTVQVHGLEAAVDNAVRHSEGFGDVVSALGDLPSAAGGVLFVDHGEDDTTPLHEANPAQADGSSGKRDSLVLDARRGGLRFLSSMPEYPSGPTGADEERVPFVFQTRLNDDRQVYDDEASGEEWNCGWDVARCSGDNSTICMTDLDCARTVGGICQTSGEGPTDPGMEWKNCPSGNDSWGQVGGSKQYWHSGQCNVGPTATFGTSGLCSGPHILEVRYPSTPGRMTNKPVFAVGNGGVAIYEPEHRSIYWRAYLTMFRSDSGAKANHPMYVFDRGGFFADGGAFFGGSPYFPNYAGHRYTQFNAAVHHDILPENPAFVVFGPRGFSTAAETGAMVRFYDPSNGRFSKYHPEFEREAFGFYNHSRLYLGSYQDSDPELERNQFVEWEGRQQDGNTTRLGLAAEPTSANFIGLPDATGVVALTEQVAHLTGDETLSGEKRFSGTVAVDGRLRFGTGRGAETCLSRDAETNRIFLDGDCDGILGEHEAYLDPNGSEAGADERTCNTILAVHGDAQHLSEPGVQDDYSFTVSDAAGFSARGPSAVPLMMPTGGVFHDLQAEVTGLTEPCAYEARLVLNDVETELGCEAGGNNVPACADLENRVSSHPRDRVRLRVRMSALQPPCYDVGEVVSVSLCWSSHRVTGLR